MEDLCTVKKTLLSKIFTCLPLNTSFLTVNVCLLLKNDFKMCIVYEVCI